MITVYVMAINKSRVVAEFGTGDICIAPMQGENGEHRLGFINQTPREIGSGGDYVNGDIVDCNNFPILFEFAKPESIDVIIRALEDVKKQFTT
jgi:hypothetical protein